MRPSNGCQPRAVRILLCYSLTEPIPGQCDKGHQDETFLNRAQPLLCVRLTCAPLPGNGYGGQAH